MPERRRGYHLATLTVRQLATGLASNRILFGLGFVLVPAHLASDPTDFAATCLARSGSDPAANPPDQG